MIKTTTPPEAWDTLQNNTNAILLDVRTTMEFQYIGHPVNAIHVPLMEAPAWKADPEFVEKALAALTAATGKDPKDLTILALCRSGKRSEAALELLMAAGYNDIINILDGFEGDIDNNKHRGNISGWKFHQLPWEQS